MNVIYKICKMCKKVNILMKSLHKTLLNMKQIFYWTTKLIGCGNIAQLLVLLFLKYKEEFEIIEAALTKRIIKYTAAPFVFIFLQVSIIMILAWTHIYKCVDEKRKEGDVIDHTHTNTHTRVF